MKKRIFNEKIEEITYEIRQTSVAKKVMLRISGDGRVWVSMPPFTSPVYARAFVKEQLPFIRQTLATIQEKRAQKETEKNGEFTLPFRGKWLPVSIERGEKHDFHYDSEREILRITIPHESENERHDAHTYWKYCVITEANEELTRRLVELAHEVGESLAAIGIRNQKSKWGSCTSARRSISLNWRLVLVPESVRDYILYHELAHLRHPNHSARFWSLVELWCPHYQESEEWLKKNGRKIFEST